MHGLTNPRKFKFSLFVTSEITIKGQKPKHYWPFIIRGSGGKSWKLSLLLENNGFCRIFIQSFSVEIRPNKQFIYARVDGAVD
jgi:hypothetical protein